MAAKNRLTAKTVAHPDLLPACGEKETGSDENFRKLRACAPFTRAVKPLTMQCVGERRA
jgi:hypothetical protein